MATCTSIQLPALLFVCVPFFLFLLFVVIFLVNQGKGRGLFDHKLVQAPPVIFIAGRPKAVLLFWFFGDLDLARCYL